MRGELSVPSEALESALSNNNCFNGKRMRSKAIWITWESQVRNRSISRNLGIRLFELNYGGARLIRYGVCLYKTASLLIRERPSVIFSSNPSIVLALFLLHMKALFRYRYIIDAHFIGVMAYEKGQAFQRILDYCNRTADMVIVTNSEHADHVTKIGGKAFVCEDPLPEFPDGIARIEKGQGKWVFFICSFDADEPYKEVFEAAKYLLKDGFTFYVSGNYAKAEIKPEDYPYIKFLGYVPYSTFYSYLISCDVVMDLTSCDNCLICGAYEAMAAEKALVTSNTEAIRNYFTHGAVYTDHQPEDMAKAIRIAYNNRDRVPDEIRQWKTVARRNLLEKIAVLKKYADM